MTDSSQNAMDFLSGIPILGNLLESPKDASRKQQALLEQISQQYAAQRGPQQDARMSALSQNLSLFNPLNELMRQQYGSGATMDFSKALKNPMADEQGIMYDDRLNQAYVEVDMLNKKYGDKFKNSDTIKWKDLGTTIQYSPDNMLAKEEKLKARDMIEWNPKTRKYQVKSRPSPRNEPVY